MFRLTLGDLIEDRWTSGYGELCNLHAVRGSLTLLEEQLDSDDGSHCPVGSLGARDALGRITEREERAYDPASAQVVSRHHSYAYDGGRLHTADVGTEHHEYHYSLNGRRTWWANPDLHLRVDDDQNRSFTIWNEGGTSTEYRFNADGEIVAKEDAGGTVSYRYDSFGRLKQVDFPGGRSILYVLDGRHRRVGKMGRQGTGEWQIEQAFLYSGSQVVAELDENGQLVSRFVYGSRAHVPDYVVSFDGSGQPTEYRIISDHLGSPRMVVRGGATLEVVATYEYDEFGIRTSVWEDEDFRGLPFGFAGGLYDGETGLVHFGAREYDPDIGQWTSRDPILFAGGDTNLYGYVLNDPVNLIDPSGLECEQNPPRESPAECIKRCEENYKGQALFECIRGCEQYDPRRPPPPP